jgi:hypothetical protein
VTTTPATSLATHVEEIQRLHNVLEVAEGELTAEVAAEWEAAWAALSDKVDAIGYAERQLRIQAEAAYAEAEAAKALAGELKAKADAITNRKRRLMEWVKYNMGRLGTKRLEGTVWQLKIEAQGGQPRLDILAPVADFPSRYLAVRTELDKDAIRRGLEVGDPELVGLARLADQGEIARVR